MELKHDSYVGYYSEQDHGKILVHEWEGDAAVHREYQTFAAATEAEKLLREAGK